MDSASTQHKEPWFVAINGAEHDERFEDEQTANDYAAARRGTRSDSRAPDLSKKVAVYQRHTPRHAKAIASGAAPKPEKTAAPAATTETKEPTKEPEAQPKRDSKAPSK